MFFKHLRTKIEEGKRGIMSLEHPSQVPDKYGLEPGEKMLSRLAPVQKEPPKANSSKPSKVDLPKPSEVSAKDSEEKAKSDYAGGVAAMNARFKEMDKEAEKGHSILGGRGWEGKIGKSK